MTVDTEALDVGDAASMAQMMAKFGGERPALGGIFHAAVAGPTSAPLATMFPPELLSGDVSDEGRERAFAGRTLDESTRQVLRQFLDDDRTSWLGAARALRGGERRSRCVGVPAQFCWQANAFGQLGIVGPAARRRRRRPRAH